MKILAVSTWFPYPPDNGAKARAHHLLRALGRAHSLDLIALSQSDRDARHMDEVREFCRRLAVFPEPVFRPGKASTWLKFFSPVPRYFHEHHSPRVDDLARRWTEEEHYDAMVAVTLGAAPYASDLDIPFKVLDQHNVECKVIQRRSRKESNLVRRLRYTPTWIKAERFERGLVSAFDVVTVVSDIEQGLMSSVLRNGHGRDIRVIPSGVDPGLLDYESEKDPRLLIFTGAPTYGPNFSAVESLCREVLPAVRAEIGDVKLTITGDARGVDTGPLTAGGGVEFTGYVDDIRPILGSASALVVPLRLGGGTRLKILEAMAIGTPVISTPMGAEGIDARDGTHILLGETPADLARRTCRLLADPELAAGIARNARDLVRERYQWPVIADRFVSIFSGKETL